MSLLFIPFQIVQIILILLWTAFSGSFALLLRIFLPAKVVIYFVSHYMWSPLICLLSGVRLTVEGLEHVDHQTAHIYVANHESQMDITVIVRAVTLPLFFVAKKELAKVPVLGWYISAMNMIFIDRKDREKAMESMRKATERIKAGLNVITFPEGTRSKTGELMVFKKGSFVIAKDGEVGIIPIAIKGTRAVLPSGAFLLKPGKVTVKIGRPIHPSEFKDLTSEQLAELARTRIAEMIRS
ncbi:MAG: 1-acyl-sn-glycerol-3-phosphate acyltransferase [Bacteroidota bacterium]|jgi:1-acyl-sn-glycerol-3-phosphate acyltransferase